MLLCQEIDLQKSKIQENRKILQSKSFVHRNSDNFIKQNTNIVFCVVLSLLFSVVWSRRIEWKARKVPLSGFRARPIIWVLSGIVFRREETKTQLCSPSTSRYSTRCVCDCWAVLARQGPNFGAKDYNFGSQIHPGHHEMCRCKGRTSSLKAVAGFALSGN